MDCETCTDRLVDLLGDEIEDADTEAARAHIATCESCAGAFSRLSAGRELASFLVMAEPPAAVRAAILAAARERASARVSRPDAGIARAVLQSSTREPERPSDGDEPGDILSSLMRWLGGFAMGPQVAMAMMLFLMVGIGLWYLPELRRHDPADTHAIVDPAAGEEVGPSAGIEPAEPLVLEADPRTGRIRPRDDAPEERRAPPRVADARQGADRALEVARPARPPIPTPSTEPAREAAQEAQVITDPLDSPETAFAELDLEPGQEAAASGALRAAPPPSQPSAPAPAVVLPSRVETGPMDGLAAAGRARTVDGSPPATAEARYQRGVQRFEQRDYRGAADDFESVVRRPDTDARRLLPTALHQLARSQSGAGSCPQAIGSYERLLAAHPSYGGASEARLELAECYRRTGQLTRARSLLETASRDTRFASRAQRELVRLEAAERAMDRASETARTPGRPAAPTEAADDAHEAQD